MDIISTDDDGAQNQMVIDLTLPMYKIYIVLYKNNDDAQMTPISIAKGCQAKWLS